MEITRGKLTILFIFLFLLNGAAGCGDEEPTKEEVPKGQQVADKLTAHTWVPGTVEHETDGDLTEMEYSEFSIQFMIEGDNYEQGGTYSAMNGSYAFPNPQGTWSWVENSDYTKIEREDGVVMDINVSDNSLTMEFNVPAQETARMNDQYGESSDEMDDETGMEGDDTGMRVEGMEDDEMAARQSGTSGNFVFNLVPQQ